MTLKPCQSGHPGFLWSFIAKYTHVAQTASLVDLVLSLLAKWLFCHVASDGWAY
jgi:hypothetical protein